MKKILFLTIFGFFLNFQNAWCEIKTEVVEYKSGDTILEGFLAYDDSITEKRPGVIVVHEWKGLTDYVKMRARKLAELGYVAFAADIYGKGVRPETHEEAAKVSGIYRNDRQLLRERGKAAFDLLNQNERVDSGRIAAIGYCFGGTTVLELARAGFPLVGVASFHGGLGTPLKAQPGQVKSKVLVLHGAMDKFVPPQEVAEFQKEMKDAGVDMRFIAYEGAVHSFTVPEAGDDPTKGMAYHEKADHDSWEELKKFLVEVFNQEPAKV